MAKEETVIETVTLTDGRIVEFAGKRKALKESFVTADGAVAVRFDFRNGETRTFTIPQSLVLKFAAHGAEQKLGDEYAGVADVDDIVVAFDDLTERLNKGEWSQARESSGVAGASVLIKALMESSGKSVDVVRAYLANKSQAEKVALRNSGKLKPIVERLEAEKAARSNGKPKVDTDALLGELDGIAAE